MQESFYIKTFGCKVNFLDSEKIKNLLLQKLKYQKECDYLIVNTCTVTSKADNKAIHFIKNWKSKNKNCKIIVVGCGVKLYKEYKNIQEVSFILQNLEDIKNFFDIEDKNKNNLFLQSRTRQFVQIQNGCDNFCSYCVIPYTRGENIYYPEKEIIKKINFYEEKGIKEIVITGINIGGYGVKTTKDYQNSKLGYLLRQILKYSDIPRIRLSSIGPQYINENFLKVFSDNRICSHLHLSIQSGSDKILKLQNRHYSRLDVINKAKLLYNIKPNLSITTDIIVGFSTESDIDFEYTLDLLKEINISKIHIFPYSQRDIPIAYKFKSDLDNKILQKRIDILKDLNRKMRIQFLEKNLNQNLNILIEQKKDGFYQGYSENYILIKTRTKLQTNQIYQMKFSILDRDNLILLDKI